MDDLRRADITAITLASLQAALTAAGEEDIHWEAKGNQGEIRPDHVIRAVAGMYNREGGLLILGATPAQQGWVLDGLEFPEAEVELWLSKVIRDNLRPAPECQFRSFRVDGGRVVALVRVPPGQTHFAVTGRGVVFRREHGATPPFTDGTRLTELLLERVTSASEAPVPRVTMGADAWRRAIEAVVERGKEQSLVQLHPQLRASALRAAERQDQDDLALALDKHVELTALLLQRAPEHPSSHTSLKSWHALFDEARALPRGPAVPGLDVWLGLRIRVYALAALCKRLQLWSQLRVLAAHASVQTEASGWASWLTEIDVEVGRRQQAPSNDETYRWPLRAAAELAADLPTLNPDGLDQEDLVAAVVAGEFLARLIELDVADRAGRSKETYPACALFDTRPLHGLAAQLAEGGAITGGLFSRVQADILRLMAELDDRCRASVGSGGFWLGFADSETEQRMRRFAANS